MLGLRYKVKYTSITFWKPGQGLYTSRGWSWDWGWRWSRGGVGAGIGVKARVGVGLGVRVGVGFSVTFLRRVHSTGV